MCHLTKANPRGGGKRYAAAATANAPAIEDDEDEESDDEDEEYTARAAAANAQATARAQRVWELARELRGLFEEQRGGPAVEFGCFAAVYGPPGGAMEGQALLRVDVGMHGLDDGCFFAMGHARGLGIYACKCNTACTPHYLAGDMRGGSRTKAPIYLVVPRETIHVLQDMGGGDEARVSYLLGVPGVRFVGRQASTLEGWG